MFGAIRDLCAVIPDTVWQHSAINPDTMSQALTGLGTLTTAWHQQNDAETDATMQHTIETESCCAAAEPIPGTAKARSRPRDSKRAKQDVHAQTSRKTGRHQT